MTEEGFLHTHNKEMEHLQRERFRDGLCDSLLLKKGKLCKAAGSQIVNNTLG